MGSRGWVPACGAGHSAAGLVLLAASGAPTPAEGARRGEELPGTHSRDLEGPEVSAGSCGDPRLVSLGPASCHGAHRALRASQRKTLQTLRGHWEKALCRVLRETKNHLEGEVHKGRFSLYPFLCLLDEREVVRMLLQVRLPLRGRVPGRGGQVLTASSSRSCRRCPRRASPSPPWPGS